MTGNRKRSNGRFTPEKAQSWTMALYPAAILLGSAFLLITNRPITTEIIGLFVGLLTAASLQAAVKKNGDRNAESDDLDSVDRSLRLPRREVLEDDDRGGTNNFNRWRDFRDGVFRRKSEWLPARGCGV